MRIPKRWLHPDERVLIAFRPHWRRLVPVVLLAMAAAAAAGAAVAALDPPAQWWVVGGLAAGWTALAARPLTRRRFTRTVLTDRRLLVRVGMVARAGTEVPLTHVANVRFRQSIIDRLIGAGTVTIELLGDRDDIDLLDVPAPASVEAAVWSARGHHPADGGPSATPGSG